MKEVKLMAAPHKDDEEEAHRQGKWDLETIISAEEIKSDPKKMKHVMKHAKHKMASMKSIQDLKEAYDAKYGEGKLFQKRKEAMKANDEEKE